MNTIAQFDYNDLVTAFKECNRELINEFRTMPVHYEKPDRCLLDEACEITDLQKSALYKLTADGKIPFERYGHRLVFSRQKLNEWKQGRTLPPPTADEIMSRRLARSARKKHPKD